MSASIVTFANLGKKRNIPTQDILPVIDTFVEKGALDRVICQIQKDFYFPRTYGAIPTALRYGIRAWEKLRGRHLPRSVTEHLFDYFAQYKIRHSDITFFHRGYFLPRTFRRARQLGSITIDIAGTAHLGFNRELEEDEWKLIAIRDAKGVFTKLYKEGGHYNQFDYLIAMSDFARQSYIEYGYPADKIFVAYPNIDTTRFFPTHAPRKDGVFQVVYAGYTTPLKGVGYLIEAWKSLRLENAELVLVGGWGEMPEELKRRYEAEIAADPSIRWIGNSHAPERYMQEASVFVFPSLTEGFGRVTLEAMACGIPVITTENAAGIVENGKTGFVVPIRDAKALAEKIRYFYANPDQARMMGKEARRAVEEKKPFGEAVYGIYKEVMERKNTI